MKQVVLLVLLVNFLIGCSKSAGTSAAGGSVNQFTTTGAAITVDNIVSAPGASSSSVILSGSTDYYGRVLYKNGGSLFAAAIHFTLNKASASTAYFSNFFIDRLVQITSYNNATPQVTSSTTTNVAAAYSASNTMTIQNASSRFVSFSIAFGDHTYFSDVTNAGVIFSNDFSTMAGGNNSSFFFIAQKASSMASVTVANLLATWGIANFTVNGSGAVSVASTSTVKVSGTGGNGLTAFTGLTSAGTAFQGELALTDAGTGVFSFGYDSSRTRVPPTAAGTVDGVFLLSPDLNYILGYDTVSSLYFAASR